MRTLADPPRGFTLVEMLVVLMLLGIVSLATVINFSRSDRTILMDEGRRLAIDLELAFDQSRMSGRAVALVFDAETGYHFLQMDIERRWMPASDSLSGRRQLQGIWVDTVFHDGMPVKLGVPLVFTPSRGTAKIVVLAMNDLRLQIVLSPFGGVEIVWLN